MPNKHNTERRHHIPKMKFKVTNWAEYDAGLRRRGSLTLWVTNEVIDGWQAAHRSSRGGQALYSDLAIEAGLTLHLTFHLPLRQTEGLMASLFELLGVALSVPDHSTLSRRAMSLASVSKGSRLSAGPVHLLIDSTGLKGYGAGEWLQEKHGTRARRTWRKLHLSVDSLTGTIMASILTENAVGDPSQVAPLLDQVDARIGSVTADAAYERRPATAGAHWSKPRWDATRPSSARACARSLAVQHTEAAVGVAVLNLMLNTARPNSVRYTARAS